MGPQFHPRQSWASRVSCSCPEAEPYRGSTNDAVADCSAMELVGLNTAQTLFGIATALTCLGMTGAQALVHLRECPAGRALQRDVRRACHGPARTPHVDRDDVGAASHPPAHGAEGTQFGGTRRE